MKSPNRHYTVLDRFCLGLDQILRTATGNPAHTHRTNPAANMLEPSLSPNERELSARLMRVNHAGEICAQALYHGQGLASREQATQKQMQAAAIEEGDHLTWCQTRLMELGSHQSYLNPVWYAGSFTIGFIAGVLGDKWSLGFLAETEQQVVKHLENHLQVIPQQDTKSIKIIEQMHQDEAAHRDDALNAGAATLPFFIKKLMHYTSKIMVKTSYWF